MRIAFIMLCHQDPDQINMLIKKLLEFPDSDVFVHVDLNQMSVKNRIKKQDNVFFVPEEKSFHIRWGGVEIVHATLQLIREVRKQRGEYDYIWLVSGQDYPIYAVNEIERRLEAKPGMNYIETILPGDKRYNWYKKLYEVSYPSWINKDTFAIKAAKRLIKVITGGEQHTFSIFARKKPFSFNFAFGSQWWTITYDAAIEIAHYSDEHPEVLEYFRKSIIPDEGFFQTLFMRGPYSEQRARNLTFINWGKNHRSPEILTELDSEKVKEVSKDFCFARKFWVPESLELITDIDSHSYGNGSGKKNGVHRWKYQCSL